MSAACSQLEPSTRRRGALREKCPRPARRAAVGPRQRSTSARSLCTGEELPGRTPGQGGAERHTKENPRDRGCAVECGDVDVATRAGLQVTSDPHREALEPAPRAAPHGCGSNCRQAQAPRQSGERAARGWLAAPSRGVGPGVKGQLGLMEDCRHGRGQVHLQREATCGAGRDPRSRRRGQWQWVQPLRRGEQGRHCSCR